jgi:hypothetical protein
MGQACCSPIGLGHHRGVEGASEQALVEVKEVVRQQKASTSKPPWSPPISWPSRPVTSRLCSLASSSPCRSDQSLSFMDGWPQGLASGSAVGHILASPYTRVPCRGGPMRELRREQQRHGSGGDEQRRGAAAPGGDERWWRRGSGAGRGFDLEHEWKFFGADRWVPPVSGPRDGPYLSALVGTNEIMS